MSRINPKRKLSKNESFEIYKLRWRERVRTLDSANQSHDKILTVLIPAIIGFSIHVANGKGILAYACHLYVSWMFLGISLFLLVLSFHIHKKYIIETAKFEEDCYLKLKNETPQISEQRIVLRYTNCVIDILFLLGLVLLVIWIALQF